MTDCGIRPWRSLSCEGERCSMCNQPAAAKVAEVIMSDDPFGTRHELTAYVCAMHFGLIMGAAGVNWVENYRNSLLADGTGEEL